MGLGVLGERVAKALAQFDFPSTAGAAAPRPLMACAPSRARRLNDFLAASRVLVNLLPLTPETANILNRDTLARLQPAATSSTWRVARTWWMKTCWRCWTAATLAGATLDVFRTEPLPAGHAFWNHPRITITPHTSARTLRDESIAQIAGKIGALERGEAIAGIVDPARGYDRR
jgi:glyoxylate/hydroxypyruvate reductase A